MSRQKGGPSQEIGVQPSPSYRETLAAFREPLVRFFARRTGDAIGAEDLAQEVLARALGRQPQSPVEQPNAFIFTIAANLLRDLARRGRGGLHLPLSEVSPIPAEDIDPSRVLEARDTLEKVVSALGEMNERTRDIFLLYRLDGLKQRDIAERLGVSVSAVEKHIAKAMAHLAQRRCRP